MLQKPDRGTMPAREMAPIRKVQWVMGMARLSPLNLRMSMMPPMACITEPDARKSRALKKAWVNRWNMAATTAKVTAWPGSSPRARAQPRARNM